MRAPDRDQSTPAGAAAPVIGSTPTPEQLEGFARAATAAGRRVVVGAIIVDEAGRVYVQRRSLERALFPGCWDLVGGHVEGSEGVAAALAREILEETGWRLLELGPTVELLDWSGSDGVERSEIDLLARVAGDLANPRLEPQKHVEGRWLGPDELEVLAEGRREDDRWVSEVVSRAFALVPAWDRPS